MQTLIDLAIEKYGNPEAVAVLIENVSTITKCNTSNC